MGILRKITLFTAFVAIGAALSAFPAERVYAGTWDILYGDITIDCTSGKQKVNDVEDPDPVITNTTFWATSIRKVVINTSRNCTAKVKFSGVNISLTDDAAVNITGDGNAIIELSGENTLESGYGKAGLQKESTGLLEIRGNGSLNATGGDHGAGIGGGYYGAGSDIEITGGTVTATGGDHGSGIGGGMTGAGSNIIITGGTVTAVGNIGGAGIGGGDDGAGTGIKITGGTVTAISSNPLEIGVYNSGSGIGGGYNGAGSDIEITGGTVTAIGGYNGAGIGGGSLNEGTNILVSGGTVTATGGDGGAGIGGGDNGYGSYIEISGETVTATGGKNGAGIGGGDNGYGSYIKITGGTVNATGGDGGAGIGGGDSGYGSYIEISGETVTATGGDGGAGIGGGYNSAGSNIIIAGGTETATGGDGGAGIGGGVFGTGSDIRISNDAKVMAAGGKGDSSYGAGAAIGDGGKSGGDPGDPANPDTEGLYDTGSVECYDAGIKTDAMKKGTVTPARTIKGDIIVNKTITFDANGGSCLVPSAKTVSSNNGSQVLSSLPDATRDDYTFDGWFTAREGGDKITTAYDFPGNMTVYAHWTYNAPAPETYTVTFDPNGGTVSPTSGTTGTDGKFASLPTPVREGYSFTGWFTEKDGGTEVTTSTVFTSDATVFAHWKKDKPTPEPDPKPTPSPAPNPAMDNLPSEYSTVPRDDYLITYAGRIPFPGKSKVTVKNFGATFTVSQGDATYTVTKIKVNKKNKKIQVTGLENADKKIVKEVKKATKGGDGLSFDYTPYYVKDTDKVEPKFKNDELKSVKILINGKLYKAKNTEYEYDKEKKVITFKAPNLGGSYRVP